MARFRSRFQSPVLLFDLQDHYARDRAIYGQFPRPLGQIRFEILGRSTGNSPQLWKTYVRLYLVRNDNGDYIWFGKLASQEGVVLHDVLTPGNYVLRISSPFHVYQVNEIDPFVIPGQDTEPDEKIRQYDLEPGHAYPFPLVSTLSGGRGATLLRGSLRRTDGRPIAGASVESSVPEVSAFRTDDSGEWILAFPDDHPSGEVTLTATLPNDGNPVVITVPDIWIEQGRVSSLRQTALRGRVIDVAQVGIDGATVAVEGLDGQTRAGTDGIWTYYFPLDQTGPIKVSVTATHPDGRTMTQTNIEVKPKETSAVPVFGFTN
jgi:hypothetical protein